MLLGDAVHVSGIQQNLASASGHRYNLPVRVGSLQGLHRQLVGGVAEFGDHNATVGDIVIDVGPREAGHCQAGHVPLGDMLRLRSKQQKGQQ